jgi:citrate synthase
MVDYIRGIAEDWGNREKLKDYLYKIIKKEAYDKRGLIYGMRYAAYTLFARHIGK